MAGIPLHEGDKMSRLTAMMMSDTKSPTEQSAAGRLPNAPPIIVLPRDTNNDVQTRCAALMDVTSVSQLYSNILQMKQQPEGLNITTEAGSAFATQARSIFDAMMGPMAGFYQVEQDRTETYNDTVARSQLHPHLLGKIFGRFGFSKSTMDQLDQHLTALADSLKKIPVDKSPSNRVDFLIRLNLLPKTNISGDDSNPEWVYDPTTHIFYVAIDLETFRQSLNKDNGADPVNFKFTMTSSKCRLDIDRFMQNRVKFDKIIQFITNNDLRTYSQLLNKQIKSDQG